MLQPNTDLLNKEFHSHILKRFKWLYSLKPKSFANIMKRLMAPDERRRIIDTGIGIRFYGDPLTNLGRQIVLDSRYEKETIETFRSEVKPGQVVLDVGANEGLFSALAGTIVGSQGLVISVEPQSRLRDLIEINFCINNVENFRIFLNALGGEDGEESELNIYPSMYTGQSGLIRKYKYSISPITEKIKFVSLNTILKECKVDLVDFVKVDVEGFEDRVVKALLPAIAEGKVGKLLLDYHTEILLSQNSNPLDIHKHLIERGMVVKSSLFDKNSSHKMYGDISTLGEGKRAYILYEYRH